MHWLWGIIFVACFVAGGQQMKYLIENPEAKIHQLNFKYGFWGTIFVIISWLTSGYISIIFSGLFSLCFGLIGVSLMFEKRVK